MAYGAFSWRAGYRGKHREDQLKALGALYRGDHLTAIDALQVDVAISSNELRPSSLPVRNLPWLAGL